jgi:tRNA threonylcarbamoyladenosine biosynthesis protein TsaE
MCTGYMSLIARRFVKHPVYSSSSGRYFSLKTSPCPSRFYTYVSRSEEDTEILGSRFANWLMSVKEPENAILCLHGDVGSGKSVFSRGFVREIVGSKTDVPSPTYLLANEYEDRKNKTRIIHADLYRLCSDSDDFDVLGIPFNGMTDKRTLCLIEWPERLIKSKDFHSRLDLFFQPQNFKEFDQPREIRVDTAGSSSSSSSKNWRYQLVQDLAL